MPTQRDIERQKGRAKINPKNLVSTTAKPTTRDIKDSADRQNQQRLSELAKQNRIAAGKNERKAIKAAVDGNEGDFLNYSASDRGYGNQANYFSSANKDILSGLQGSVSSGGTLGSVSRQSTVRPQYSGGYSKTSYTPKSQPNVSGTSQAAKNLLDFSAQRKQQRSTQATGVGKRDLSILSEEKNSFLNNLKSEQQTNEYKTRALEAEGFGTSAPDSWSWRMIQEKLNAGGHRAVMDWISQQGDTAGDDPTAQQERYDKFLNDYERFQTYQSILAGEYISPEDQEILDNMDTEYQETQAAFNQAATDQQTDIQSEREADVNQFYDAQMQQLSEEFDTSMISMKSTVDQYPEISTIFSPIINNLLSNKNNLDKQYAELQMASYDSSQYQKDLGQYAEVQQLSHDLMEDILMRHKKLRIDAAESAKSTGEAQLKIKKIQDAAAQQRKRAQNIANDVANRRLSNRLGIEGDTNGLKWMRDELEQGAKDLDDMIRIANIENIDIARQISDQYQQSVESALLDYEAKNIELDQNLNDTFFRIQSTINSLKKEDAEQAKTDIKDYWAARKANDDALATAIGGYREAMFNERIRLEQKGETDRQSVYDRLETHVSTYGNENQAGYQFWVGQLAKLGVDTSKMSGTAPTLAQIQKTKDENDDERLASMVKGFYNNYTYEQASAMAGIVQSRGLQKHQRATTGTQLEAAARNGKESFQRALPMLAIRGLSPASAKIVSDKVAAVGAIDRSLELLKKIDTSIYNSYYQGKKRLADAERDPNFRAAMSQIGMLSAAFTKDLFGANFTESEQGRARAFIADYMNGEPEGDMIAKLEEYKMRMNWDTYGLLRETQAADYIRSYAGDDVLGYMTGAEPLSTQVGNDPFAPGGDIYNMIYGGETAPTDYGSSLLDLGDPTKLLDDFDNGVYQPPATYTTSFTPVIQGPVQVTGYGSSIWGKGVDIWAKKGTPIVLHTPAKVLSVTTGKDNPYMTPDPKYMGKGNESWGNSMLLDFGGGLTGRYSHLDKLNVKAGDELDVGQFMATVGNSGSTLGPTGVHLDFTLYKDGVALPAEKAASFLALRNIQ